MRARELLCILGGAVLAAATAYASAQAQDVQPTYPNAGRKTLVQRHADGKLVTIQTTEKGTFVILPEGTAEQSTGDRHNEVLNDRVGQDYGKGRVVSDQNEATGQPWTPRATPTPTPARNPASPPIDPRTRDRTEHHGTGGGAGARGGGGGVVQRPHAFN
jgi:hypothetical protein